MKDSQQVIKLVDNLTEMIVKIGMDMGKQSRKYFQELKENSQEDFQKFARYIQDGYKCTVSTQAISNYNPSSNIENAQIPKKVKNTPNLMSLNQNEDIPYIAKRPRNAYNLFVQSESSKIKAQFPDMGAPDIVRVAAQRYKKMSDDEKQPYMDKCEQMKMLFDRQRQIYGDMNDKKVKGVRKRGKRHGYKVQ